MVGLSGVPGDPVDSNSAVRAHLNGMVLKGSYDFGWCPHTVGNASRTSKTWCIT